MKPLSVRSTQVPGTTTLAFNNVSFELLADYEWLITNGLGGFAMGTLSGANTRRYHGLLVAALHPPTDRYVIVSKLEETIQLAGQEQLPLSSNEYPGVIHPSGYRLLKSFERAPVPNFVYSFAEFQIRKRICMLHERNVTLIEYSNESGVPVNLVLRPFLVFRDYHQLIKAHDVAFVRQENMHHHVSFTANGMPLLHIFCTHFDFSEDGQWYYNTVYRHETERGLDDTEDVYSPGVLRITLTPGEKTWIGLSLDEVIDSGALATLFQDEIDRLLQVRDAYQQTDLVIWASQQPELFKGNTVDQVVTDLIQAGDQFLVKRASTDGYSIIAGYPWFTDWGRDTMIAMRGLVIAPGKKQVAESIIGTFLQSMSDGMLPNRFPDRGEKPEYNTIDATLWLFVVIHDYLAQFGDEDFVKAIYPKLEEIIVHHISGTRFNIHMTEEGLLYGGEGETQLTWMDAKMGDHAFTPRHGCAVEINALWYNALRILHKLARRLFNETSPYGAIANKTQQSFVKYFDNVTYLNDVVLPGQSVDSALRPNQLYAISLPYAIVSHDIVEQVLETVSKKLVTPMGLRTLDSDDPSFVGVYSGDQWHRDSAYHQGTVWPFLIGEYWLAYLRQHQYSENSKTEVVSMMLPIVHHFYLGQCIHGISEVFDGADPDRGKGCIHQAWSVGMLLKVLDSMMKWERGNMKS